MGVKGPAPKPIAVRKREGTYNKAQHGEPVVIGGHLADLEPSDRLTPAGQKAWRELVPLMSASGLLDRADIGAVEMMVEAYAEWQEALELLKVEGSYVSSPNGYKIAHPAITVKNKAAQEYRAWSARFGLTPSDRVGLGIATIKGRSLAQDLTEKLGPSPRKAKAPE